jgi:hypothetical protein
MDMDYGGSGEKGENISRRFSPRNSQPLFGSALWATRLFFFIWAYNLKAYASAQL